VPEGLDSRRLSRERDTVTALRQSQCHISGLIIRWDRFNAPRARVVKEAVAAQADIGGEPLMPHAPDLNRGEACDGHVTYYLSSVILRTSGRCTLDWMPGVPDTAAVEVFTGCVPVRGAYSQPALAHQRARPCPPALRPVAGHQEEFARVLGGPRPHRGLGVGG
jgi:hypothetical protein